MAGSDRESGPEALEGPGQRLKLSRQERGLSVAEVADALHLDRSMIEALEADDYDNLPPATFTKGYFRAYARYLALNEEVLLAAYERFNRGDDQRPLTAAVGAEGKAASAHRGGRGWWLLLAIVALGAGAAFFVVSQDDMPGWVSDLEDRGLDAVMPSGQSDSAASDGGSGDGEAVAGAESDDTAGGADGGAPGSVGSGSEQPGSADSGGDETASRSAEANGEAGTDTTEIGTQDTQRAGSSSEQRVAVPEGALSGDRRVEGVADRGGASQPRAEDQPSGSVDPRRALENDPLMGAESLLESAQSGNTSVSGDEASFGGPLSEAPPEPGRDGSGDGDVADDSTLSQARGESPDTVGTEAVVARPGDSGTETPGEPGASEPGRGGASADDQVAIPSTAPMPQADSTDQATLVFTFEGQSWMEVRDARDRKLLFELVTEPGRREVRGVPPFQLVIGDVEQVEVRYEGEPVDLDAYSRQGMARLELGGS